MKRLFLIINLIFVIIRPQPLWAGPVSLYDVYPNAVAYYYGVTGKDAIGPIMVGQFHRWPEHIQSVEYSRTLSVHNWFRRLVHPLTNVVQISANFTERYDGHHHITEFNPYFNGRWDVFPWSCYLYTSFAIGEGISYATSVPSLEKKSSANSKRLLNFLLLEATLAMPKHPEWQLILRLHHRSGAYGLYRAGNTGSNDIGLGLRYLFR